MRTLKTHVPTAARVLLGLVFTVFGANFFLHFMPLPPEPPAAGAFLGALFGTGYLFQLLKLTEIVAGLLLLAGLFVPLALVLLAPVLVNIVAFHAFLAPSGLPLALVLLALELYLAWTHRAAYAPLLRARPASPRSDAKPTEARPLAA